MNVKKAIFSTLGLAAVALVTSTNLFAQSTATSSFTVQAKLVAPISIQKLYDMNFGTLGIGPNGGTASIGQTFNVLTTGDVKPISGQTFPAIFSVFGEAGFSFGMELQATEVTLTNGSSTMMLTDIIRNSTGKINAFGFEQILIKGKLIIAAGQATGTYISAPISVTVFYN